MSHTYEINEGSNRSRKRIENKKRKAIAFLELIKSNELTTKPITPVESVRGLITTQTSDSGPVQGRKRRENDETSSDQSDGESPHKKIKTVDKDNEDDKTRKKRPPKEIKIIDVTERKEQPSVATEIDNEIYRQSKMALRERQKLAMQRPKIFLILDELTRDTPEVTPGEVKETPPLLMMDIQHLLLYALLGARANNLTPRWCRVLRVAKVTKVVAVVLDSVSSEELKDYTESFPTLTTHQSFDINADIIPPDQYGSTVREDLLNVQLSCNQIKEKMKIVTGEEKKALKMVLDTIVMEKTVEKEETQAKNTVVKEETEAKNVRRVMDRRSIMLSSSQLLHESIPLPYEVRKQYYNFVFSKDEYAEVTSTSPLFGVDCEMVQSTASGMDLARVSFVNEYLETVYDTFVKPRARIIDYVTRFSGITKRMMDGCNTYLEDVQRHIQSMLPPDAILCGQSIGGDLRSLKMFHPYVIDTSVIFNLTGKRKMKTGLKRLTAHFLGEDIQTSSDGHSSVEDARATMQLVNLKLQNEVQFGDLAWLDGESQGLQGHSLSPNNDTQQENLDTRSIAKAGELVTGQSQPDGMAKNKLFFQNARYTEFFLKRIRQFDKKGALYDEPGTDTLYPDSEDITYLETDKKRQKQAVKCLEEKDFCLTHFYGYRDLLSSDSSVEDLKERKKNCLQELDKRIRKIAERIPDKSLLVVILPGKKGNQENSAKVFCKMTGHDKMGS